MCDPCLGKWYVPGKRPNLHNSIEILLKKVCEKSVTLLFVKTGMVQLTDQTTTTQDVSKKRVNKPNHHK